MNTFHKKVNSHLKIIYQNILPDEEINTRVIAEWYFKLFGVAISTTSTVRNMSRLSDYGFLDMVDNPHGKSHKYTWIKLTQSGRKLQKLFICINLAGNLKFSKKGITEYIKLLMMTT